MIPDKKKSPAKAEKNVIAISFEGGMNTRCSPTNPIVCMYRGGKQYTDSILDVLYIGHPLSPQMTACQHKSIKKVKKLNFFVMQSTRNEPDTCNDWQDIECQPLLHRQLHFAKRDMLFVIDRTYTNRSCAVRSVAGSRRAG